MSRNFEILERVQKERALFSVPSVDAANRGNGGSGKEKLRYPGTDAFAREEILRLLQYVFLTGKNGAGNRQQVVFCGIDNAEGSRLLCEQVARKLADQVQSQVCVIDANFRHPSPRPLFDVSESARSPHWRHYSPQNPWLWVTDNLWLAAHNSLATIGGAPPLDRVRALIRELRNESRYVIINAPPAGQYCDAAFLGQAADGIVLVLEANTTRRVAARNAKLALDAGKVRVLGTVLNNRTFPIPEKIYRLL